MVQPVRHSDHGMSLTEQVNTPPASVEAEQALLGGLMLDNQSWDKIDGRVSDGDFYRSDHRLIFLAIKKLVERNSPRDAVTLSEFLEGRNELADAGGLGYLGALVKDTPSAANIAAYADIVRERALLRDLIEAGNDIVASAFRPEGRPAREVVDEAERRVFEIAEKGTRGKQDFKLLQEFCKDLVAELDRRHSEGKEITGLSTGYKRFDEITQGLQKGDLVILAGRPSMGKTALALSIIRNAAVDYKVPVGMFSLEMANNFKCI